MVRLIEDVFFVHQCSLVLKLGCSHALSIFSLPVFSWSLEILAAHALHIACTCRLQLFGLKYRLDVDVCYQMVIVFK